MVVKKKKVVSTKFSKKRVSKVSKHKISNKKKSAKSASSKTPDKTKGGVNANELFTESEQDQDDWEEFKNETKKDDEVKIEDLEGFEFEDETYAEPEDKSGEKDVQAEEVFDDEP